MLGTSRWYIEYISVAEWKVLLNLWYQVPSYICMLLKAYSPSLIPLAQR